MTSHKDHDHDNTPADRAACRARNAVVNPALEAAYKQNIDKIQSDARAQAIEYRAADGSTFKLGDQMFNYYDMEIVTVLSLSAFDNDVPWFRTSGALLDGSRMCSFDHARRMGWMK